MNPLLQTSLSLLKRAEVRIALILALAFSLIPFDFGRLEGVAGAVADAGHFWFYLVTYLFLVRTLKCSAWKLLALLSILAGLIELIQPYVERDGNMQDFVCSSLGALCGYLWLQNLAQYKKVAVTAICAVPLFFPIYSRVEALQFQEKLKPELAEFRTKHWPQLFKPTAPDDEESAELRVVGEGELEVLAIPNQAYPGFIYLNREMPWEGFTSLMITLTLPKNDTISIRIDDNGDCKEFTDRFNRVIELREGVNKVLIPLTDMRKTPSGRDFNTNRIKKLQVFGTKRNVSEKVFGIREMRLVN